MPSSPLPSPLRDRLLAAAAFVGAVIAVTAAAVVPAHAADGGVVINEIESDSADAIDWIELVNTSAAPVDISGWVVKDNDDSRCADGTGAFVTTAAPTPGAANACATPSPSPTGTASPTPTPTETTALPAAGALVVNEVESNGDDTDWFELYNTTDAGIDVSGYVVRDNDDSKRYDLPAGSVVPARGILGYLVLDEAVFGFGLGGADEVHLFDVDGTTELDATAWTAHAATTWGRCTDATGAFGATAVATKGTANRCTGEVVTETWPGGTDVRVLDEEATFGGDLSGLDFADGGLWAVENGNGVLYRLEGVDAVPAAGWEQGRTLRYPGGGGKVDAEGVTAVGGAVYVSSERNNDQGSVSRPSVLRYDPAASGSELVADAEWNLAADFLGLGANAGLEGITFVPDSWLVAHGFVDQRTSAPYLPATYSGHGDGLFFVGVEGTAKVYAYALQSSGAFARVATIDTPFELVADVQFDRDLLWVVCDEACNGRTATYEIDAKGAFVSTHVYARPANAPDVANEGFAIGSGCIGGFAQTFYADDADTDGFSLRSGTLACGAGGTPVDPDPTPTPTGTASPSPTGTAPPVGATPPAEQSLTDAGRGGLTAPASVTAGGSVTLTVPAGTPGQAVRVWLFSTPTDLGPATVTTARTVTVGIPASVPAGSHRIVVTNAAGEVIGWAEITVLAAPGVAALAVTGGDAHTQGVLVIAGVVLLVAGFAFVRRARRV